MTVASVRNMWLSCFQDDRAAPLVTKPFDLYSRNACGGVYFRAERGIGGALGRVGWRPSLDDARGMAGAARAADACGHLYRGCRTRGPGGRGVRRLLLRPWTGR